MATIFHTSFNDRSKIPLSTSLVCRNIGLQLPQLMLRNITSIYFNFQLYLLVCPKKSCRSLYWCFFCQWCMRHNLQLLVPMPGLGRWLALLLPLLLGSPPWVSSLGLLLALLLAIVTILLSKPSFHNTFENWSFWAWILGSKFSRTTSQQDRQQDKQQEDGKREGFDLVSP